MAFRRTLTVHKMNLRDLNIDKTWTLFLDRDGVINKLLPNDYVKTWEQFEFLPGVKEAIPTLNKIFGRIIIVTNQQGIGKELYSISDLEGIHLSFILEIILAGGQIDRIYFAPQLESENNELRKPNIGMANLAKKDFPDINFSKSIILGDSFTDMQFGRTAGMITALIGDKTLTQHQKELVDIQYNSLFEFSNDFE